MRRHTLILMLPLAAAVAAGCGARSVIGSQRQNGAAADSTAPAPDIAARHDASPPADAQIPDVVVPAADLYFATFTISLNGEGRRVRYDMTICNDGPVASITTLFTVYNDLPRAPTRLDKPSVQLPVPPLAHGGCVDLTVAQGPLEHRVYRSWGFVDPDDVVSESDETNNIAKFRVFDFSRH